MNENYCAAVDTGLFIYTSGQVGVCCAGSEYLGNVNSESLQDIFEKPRFIEIRNNLKNNVQEKYCKGCNQLESRAPGSSQKVAFNDSFGYQQERNLRLVDIRWSNVCNLSCRYCNVVDSSEWRRLSNLPIVNVNKQYVESVFKEVETNRETISNLYLLGGEPLLQKHNERLLDIVKSDVKIDVLTNLSVKLDNNKVYEKLKQMPNVLWNLSFDNVGRRFEYVRHGADWQVFTKNLQTLQNDFGKHRVTFHPVYTLWNALNLKEYYEFAHDNSARVNWQLALPKIDLKDLKTDSFIVFGHKKTIIEKAIKELESIQIADPLLLGLKSSLTKDTTQPNKSKDFLEWTEKMEKFMPPIDTFKNLWPELFDLLNE